jgi:DNA (cytosine-5)-methyltransferase 1
MMTVFGVDSDKWAARTFAANFPGADVRCGKVADELPTLPRVDVLLAGPPCQDWSVAGKGKGQHGDRNGWPDFIAAVRKLQPRHFIAENVAGMLSAKHRRYFGRVYQELAECGYILDHRELDAVNFGVPQFRNRIFVWGIRAELHACGLRHDWPKPTHTWPAPTSGMFGAHGLLPAVTVGEALGLNGLAKWHNGGAEGLVEAAMEMPSPTVSGGGTDTGGAEPIRHGGLRVRRLRPDECLKLQSGPDDFAWPEGIPKTAMYRIIGNGWACAVGAALGECVRRVDPAAETVGSLFCGGGLGDVGFHGRFWRLP